MRKNGNKSGLILCLCLLGLIFLLNQKVNAASEYTKNGIVYLCDYYNNTAVTKRTTSEMPKEVTIPAYVDGCKVVKLGEQTFWCNSKLEKLVLPSTIEEIKYGACYSCRNLVSVKMQNGVKSIGTYAFDQCSKLRTIVLPDSVTELGEAVFMLCSSLEQMRIPSGIKNLPSHTFDRCTSLNKIDLPRGLKSIDCWCFRECKSLRQIVIPTSLTSFGDYDVFISCSGLERINIPFGVEELGISIFQGCSSLKSVEIPSTVKRIGSYAFAQTGIGQMEIPYSVEFIDSCAFYSTNIRSLRIYGRPRFYGNLFGAYSNIPSGFTLYGEANSTVEEQAKSEGVRFNALSASELAAHRPTISVSKKIQTITAANVKKTTSPQGLAFTLAVRRSGNGKLTYKSNNKKITVSSSGKVTVAKNYVGTATITITADETSSYKKASAKISVTVIPKSTFLTKLINPTGKKLQAAWKRNSAVTGYQVMYSTKKNYSTYKTVTIAKNTTLKSVIKSLTKGKTYYVRIRTFKTVGGKKYYSAWSKSLSKKITK